MKNRLPAWFKQEIPDATVRGRMQMLSKFKVNTVCSHAKCPNLSSCFKDLKFTFMILGDACTRNCRFCAVKKSKAPLSVDLEEPYRIAKITKELNLKFVVITSVTRDDLEDGGAGIFAKTIRLIHNIDRAIKIEALITDFQGNIESLKTVIESSPDVIAHNIETVRSLYKEIRPQASYQLSLGVLQTIKKLNPSLATKSSIMLGMGETEKEVIDAMKDLRNSGCGILTLGQYLAPSIHHYPVKEFIGLERFSRYQSIGLDMGFGAVLSGPKVRSSYQAEDTLQEVSLNKCMI